MAGGMGKTTQTLIQRLRREFPGYFAVVSMARSAHAIEEEAKRRKDAGEGWVGLLIQASNIHKEVAKYTNPQLKAVDISSAGDGLTFNFSIGQQEGVAMQQQAAEKVIDSVEEVAEYDTNDMSLMHESNKIKDLA